MKNAALPAPPWPGWKTVSLLGRGSFGAVYQIERDHFGAIELAAMKVITIPQNDSDIQELYSDGYTAESVHAHYTESMKSIVYEYSVMAKLKGCANVVYCDDIYQEQHADGIGWDIFIRMELLTPLTQAMSGEYEESATLRLGADLARALAVCGEQKIVHRDIKPRNIFVSADGTFKLGDFGIAKVTERTTSGTRIGTNKYMAPEVYHDAPYGAAVDVYSLGLVLYWMMNERRTPFLPLPPEVPTIAQEGAARTRRFGGEALPEPKHGSPELKALVLRCCAYRQEQRPSAQEILDEIQRLQMKQLLENPEPHVPNPDAEPPRPIETDEDATMPMTEWVIPPAADPDLTVPPVEQDSEFELTARGDETMTIADAQADLPPKAPAQKPEPPVKPEPEKQSKASSGKKGLLWILAAVVALAGIFAVVLLGGNSQPAQSSAGKSDSETTVTNTDTAAKGNLHLKQTKVPIAAGGFHTVGLKADGTVITAGEGGGVNLGLDEVAEWKDIVSVAADMDVTAGLKSDGTVVVAGSIYDEQCNVSDWSDIVAIDVGGIQTVGLKSDGTVVQSASDDYDIGDVSEWRDIVAITAGDYDTYGLKADGTVVTTDEYMEQYISDWSDIIDICTTGGLHGIVGLRSDGTVVVAQSFVTQDQVDDWTDIVAIAAGDYHVVGLKSNGTVVAALCESEADRVKAYNHPQNQVTAWQNIVAIAAGGDTTIALTSDGLVVGVGRSWDGQLELDGWRDIMLP